MNLVTHKLSNALSLVVIRHLVVFILSGMSNCTLLSTPDLNRAEVKRGSGTHDEYGGLSVRMIVVVRRKLH